MPVDPQLLSTFSLFTQAVKVEPLPPPSGSLSIPVLQQELAEVRDKINELLAVLKNAKLMHNDTP